MTPIISYFGEYSYTLAVNKRMQYAYTSDNPSTIDTLRFSRSLARQHRRKFNEIKRMKSGKGVTKWIPVVILRYIAFINT